MMIDVCWLIALMACLLMGVAATESNAYAIRSICGIAAGISVGTLAWIAEARRKA